MKRACISFCEIGRFRVDEIVELHGLPGKYRIIWIWRDQWITLREMTWWDLVVAWFRGERLR